MELQVSGTIKVIFDTQTFDSGFAKREFVVTTQEQYPQDIKIETVKDRISLLDTVKVGDMVTVSINLRGNEYNGRYFVNVAAWRITPMQAPASHPVGAGAPMPAGAPVPVDNLMPDNGGEEDDLPF